MALKAIYSRSQKSAELLASNASSKVDVYYDSPATPSQSIEALLSRDDVQAVIIAVPIMVQPELIRKAHAAGKHVLSEKPIAKDLSTAQDLIKAYNSQPTKGQWGVGENLRFFHSISKGAEILREMDGELVTFRTSMYTLVNEDNKFFQTDWYIL